MKPNNPYKIQTSDKGPVDHNLYSSGGILGFTKWLDQMGRYALSQKRQTNSLRQTWRSVAQEYTKAKIIADIRKADDLSFGQLYITRLPDMNPLIEFVACGHNTDSSDCVLRLTNHGAFYNEKFVSSVSNRALHEAKRLKEIVLEHLPRLERQLVIDPH